CGRDVATKSRWHGGHLARSRAGGQCRIAGPALQVRHRVPEASRSRHDRFRRCRDCAQVYWNGSRYPRLERLVSELLDRSGFSRD
ncbi:MAG: hypothetical protein KGJ55_04100, partial [Gammaproteobacteria bacterium]|nr:hypothetical protein [Gammaproteobacteria bacterium]